MEEEEELVALLFSIKSWVLSFESLGTRIEIFFFFVIDKVSHAVVDDRSDTVVVDEDDVDNDIDCSSSSLYLFATVRRVNDLMVIGDLSLC